jgi:hypothetical protein
MSLPGLYGGSYTWFEASIYRSLVDVSEEAKAGVVGGMVWESKDGLASAGVTQVPNPLNGKHTWLLQRNVRASQNVRQHTIIWTDIDERGEVEDDIDTGRGQGAGFVRSLIAGDRIAIMARALVKI